MVLHTIDSSHKYLGVPGFGMLLKCPRCRVSLMYTLISTFTFLKTPIFPKFRCSGGLVQQRFVWRSSASCIHLPNRSYSLQLR